MSIFLPLYLFKTNWLLASIVLLCIMAMVLYALIGLAEKLYKKTFLKKIYRKTICSDDFAARSAWNYSAINFLYTSMNSTAIIRNVSALIS